MYDQETVPMRKLNRRPNSRQSLSKSQLFLLVSIVLLLVALLSGGFTLFMINPQFVLGGSATGSPTNSPITQAGATTTPVPPTSIATTTPVSPTSIATATQVQPTASPTPNVIQPNVSYATFTLDHVTVTIASPFLPGTFLMTNSAATTTYVATATSTSLDAHPWGAIYITAVPYGTKPTTEGVPIARPGGAQAYRDFLYHYRASEGDTPQPGPTSPLFGQKIQSEASLMHGHATVAYSSILVVEWVVEAGKRIWIIRITEEQPLGTVDLTPATSFLASLQNLELSSDTLSKPA